MATNQWIALVLVTAVLAASALGARQEPPRSLLEGLSQNMGVPLAPHIASFDVVTGFAITEHTEDKQVSCR